jgi:hypothetical protein
MHKEDHPNTIHGESYGETQTPEYRAWLSMKRRCSNPNAASFHRYGGRGIRVCERWISGDGRKGGYLCFLEDLGRKPSSRHSLDRVDGDANYEPANCKWSTQKEQGWNTCKSLWVDFKGEKRVLAELCEEYHISPSIVRQRVKNYGWDLELALTTKIGPRGHFAKRSSKAYSHK